jgi:hypothetical protein
MKLKATVVTTLTYEVPDSYNIEQETRLLENNPQFVLQSTGTEHAVSIEKLTREKF